MTSKNLGTGNARNVIGAIKVKADSHKAVVHARYFKTGKGHYGEGDIFLGLTVPIQHVIAKQYTNLELSEISILLKSPIHEHRSVGLMILVMRFERSVKNKVNKKELADIVRFYLAHKKWVNNWDLVDGSARDILGEYLLITSVDRKILYTLARSKVLWNKRIAIVATYAFIRKGQFADTFAISRILMKDSHDLIHKAVGWMLREVGNRSQTAEEKFLKKEASVMPRTMLRYAIEKFTPAKRAFYMNIKRVY